MVTMYYLVCSIEKRPDLYSMVKNSLTRGLNFILKYSSVHTNKTMLIYDWEPELTTTRHCNFSDTSAYFYLIAMLTKLAKIDPTITTILPKPISYLNYIEENL